MCIFSVSPIYYSTVLAPSPKLGGVADFTVLACYCTLKPVLWSSLLLDLYRQYSTIEVCLCKRTVGE